MTDQEHAKKIESAIMDANNAIREAHKAGLRIDVNIGRYPESGMFFGEFMTPRIGYTIERVGFRVERR